MPIKDPEKRRQWEKEYYKRGRRANVVVRERINEVARNRHAANPEKARAKWRKDAAVWKEKHPEKVAESDITIKLKKRFGTTPPQELVEALALQRLIKCEIRKASK